MCQKVRKLKARLSANMVKFVVVLTIFLTAECAAGRYEIKKSRGSCLSYGHACWGAHGKRSGRQEALLRFENEAPPNRDDAKAEWFLSKMISPLDFRYYRNTNELNALKTQQPEIDDLFGDGDAENFKSGGEWEKVRDILKNDNRIPIAATTFENGRNLDNLLKAPKYLDKRATKE